MTGVDSLRLARAYLMRVAEPPAPHLAAFVAEHGATRAAHLVREQSVPPAVGVETEARHSAARPDNDLKAAKSNGFRLVVPEDDEWPGWPFLAFSAAARRGVRWAVAPLGLWVRGGSGLADLVDRSVAIVGARAATGYGERIATEFGHTLATNGVTVVSGAAYGIDGAAHRGALAVSGPTIAVMACGLDVCYPAGHVGLLGRVAEHGAVVSEYPPGTPAARHRFLIRNRLIAALGAGTVVVEAGARSGARSTAAAAGALGKVVMAVPGAVTSAMSVGCHDLIRSGEAILVRGADDVIESSGRLGVDLAAPGPDVRRRTDGLASDALRVHEALPRSGAEVPEHIAVQSGVPLTKVRALLPELEIAGLAQRLDVGWRLANRESG